MRSLYSLIPAAAAVAILGGPLAGQSAAVTQPSAAMGTAPSPATTALPAVTTTYLVLDIQWSGGGDQKLYVQSAANVQNTAAVTSRVVTLGKQQVDMIVAGQNVGVLTQWAQAAAQGQSRVANLVLSTTTAAGQVLRSCLYRNAALSRIASVGMNAGSPVLYRASFVYESTQCD